MVLLNKSARIKKKKYKIVMIKTLQISKRSQPDLEFKITNYYKLYFM